MGIARAVLIGHGSGGAVAIELAHARPGLAAAVIAVDTQVLASDDPVADGSDTMTALLRQLADRSIPVLLIEATVRSDLQRLAQLLPGALVGRTVEVGHREVIGQPEQAGAMIRDFLASRSLLDAAVVPGSQDAGTEFVSCSR